MSLLNVDINEILRHRPVELPLWDDVFVRSSRHNTLTAPMELFKCFRPLERDEYTQYRIDNFRPITYEVITKHHSKVNRIFAETIDQSADYPEKLQEHLNRNKYFYGGESMTLDEWIFNCAVPQSDISPNDIVLEFPFDPANPTESIVENGQTSREVDCKTTYVCYDKIISLNQDFLIWQSEDYRDIGTEKEPNQQPILYGIDSEAYYRYLPFINAKKETEYRREPWYVYRSSRYEHSDRSLPYSTLMGRIVSEKRDYGFVKYKVPFIFSAYPHGDEALLNHSNDQVTRMRHGHPKMYIDGLVCSTCGGNKTLKENKGDGQFSTKVCSACSGTGMPLNIGIFETLHTKGGKNQNLKTTGAPAGYLEEPTAILKHGWDVWRTNIEDMKRCIGLDLLEGSAGNESGRAKELRLEMLHDLIKEKGDSLIEFKQSILDNKLLLLYPNPSERPSLMLQKPKSYQIMTIGEMKATIKECPLAFRFNELMKIAQLEFKGDEKKIRSYRLSLKYAPLAIYDDLMHRRELVASGVYDSDALVKANLAQCAFYEILCRPNLSDQITDGELFELADAWFVDNRIVEAPRVLQNFPGDA